MDQPPPAPKAPGLSGFGNPLRIIFLVLSAIAGVLLSANYVFNNDRYGAPRFHEIQWNEKEISAELISKALADTGNAVMKDSTLRPKQEKALKNVLQWLKTKKDTAVNAALLKRSALFIHSKDLAFDKFSFSRTDTHDVMLYPPVRVTYADTALVNGQVTYPLALKIKRYKAIGQFFNKYPGFGLWSLLLIIQNTFYFLLVTGFFFHFTSVSANSLYREHLGYSRKTFYFLLGGMLAFVLTVYFTLLNRGDTPKLPGRMMFMPTVDNFFLLVNIAGYLAAAFCLVGMIISVVCMNQLKTKSKQGMGAALVEELRAEIKRRFNTYFVFAAIILTLAIFASSVYFSSLNGLEFTKQASRDLGYSPMNPELVYLYGIMNSFFLVLAYLPARYLITSLDKAIPSPRPPAQEAGTATGTTPAETKTPALGRLSKMLSGVTEVLVATSPFLASLLQNLLDSIFT